MIINIKLFQLKVVNQVDKNLWIEFSKVLSRIYVSIPIKLGDIICKNILNTGVDIICTRNIYNRIKIRII